MQKPTAGVSFYSAAQLTLGYVSQEQVTRFPVKQNLIVWYPPCAEGRLIVCKCLPLKRFQFNFMLSLWDLLLNQQTI